MLGSWQFLALALLGSAAWAVYGSQHQHHTEGFFNGSSYVRLYAPVSLHSHTGLSFRSCVGGELFLQKNNGNSVSLEVDVDGLLLVVTLGTQRIESRLPARLLDNNWHTVNLLYRLGNLTLAAGGHLQVVANSTFNQQILHVALLTGPNAVLIVGDGFNGCILEGPSLVFNNTNAQSHNVEWGGCPLNTMACNKLDQCYNDPCMGHGVCISHQDRYECRCAARYTGNNCEIANGSPCERNGVNPCLHNGRCEEDAMGNYKCICDEKHSGEHCEIEINMCEDNPCKNNGICRVSPGDRYECTCQPGYMGVLCEVNINECMSNPCMHGGTCIDGNNNYTCQCLRTGYKGKNCEININECENNPCLNSGVCFDNYGSYTCQCTAGFGGQNCELNLNECSSNPCENNGRCLDLVGSYKCHCQVGYTGVNCELDENECESAMCPSNTVCVDGRGSYQCVCKPGFPGVPPNCTEVSICNSMTCLNGGTCIGAGDHYNCTCLPGFTGMHCERVSSAQLADWCISSPCKNGGSCVGDVCECTSKFTGPTCETHVRCASNPCQHASACQDYNGGYYCSCDPGWTGTNCDLEINECLPEPCLNLGTCIDSVNSFYCECLAGFTGKMCQINIDECASNPCQNRGTCIDQVNGFTCTCSEDYMGEMCEREYDVCGLQPCQNNGTCINKRGSKHEYYCECLTGFEGLNCEHNVNDCLRAMCPDNKVCVDGINSYECRCPEGHSGPNCTMDMMYCTENPCLNNATCWDSPGGNQTCVCTPGFTGPLCEEDIDECKISKTVCNHGICQNTIGSYQCFCRPGFSGDHCDIDFDECLSRPCLNNATCENLINSYHCTCIPGFEGKDCGVNINECASNPCQNGSTCVDGIASFSCFCAVGLTGKMCEVNIDDCMSMPCQHGGRCIDGLNSYACDCSDTGYQGAQCEENIDDCLENPCTNGARCRDLVKDYMCECYPGYVGKNCEEDVNECLSGPCKFGSTCLEHSNITLYQHSSNSVSDIYRTLPLIFYQDFSYATAGGYECVCVPGVTGRNCDFNLDECESNPCQFGTCVDKVGGYECECEEGFEGINCEINIDECERYLPCVHGTCLDRKAGYFCECSPKYGGKNCSVELVGCYEGACLSNGTCKPYLENETMHKFNCSCSNGYHGARCEKETTMSLSGSSYLLVNTTREEGYDIQFRFRTTLPNGLLAMGKGPTYYILGLVQGRLNLHSSLLNKWHGVYIGQDLNNSNWQRVFVAINSSHLVLSANDEQTIYPISLKDDASHTSFPVTYLGGTLSDLTILRQLTHVPPFFVGCMEDVVINGNWVIPEDTSPSLVMVGTEVGCQWEPKCNPNPCQNGGRCTDLWQDFSCACERPFLGHKCQYNLTAATFGYENITNSLVRVDVNETAQRAVRNFVDISMFVRTRQDHGYIFYMGSLPQVGLSTEGTLVAAALDGGELSVILQFNSSPEFYSVTGVKLADGNNHLIQVVRNVTLVQVKINGTEYFRKAIGATGQLDVQVLYLGGLPPGFQYHHPAESPQRPEPKTTNFKGVIQDVEVRNGSHTMVVEFFPLQVEGLKVPPPFGNVWFQNDTIIEGIKSDNTCRNNPCHHNGSCFTTWNDFRCECPKGYNGKMCQEMEFCQLQDCPQGSTCRNLDDGYECVANATFDGHNNTLVYGLSLSSSGDSILKLDKVEIQYRSRTGGTILQIMTSDDNFFSVSVFQDQVTVNWRLDISGMQRFRKPQMDGNWTTVHIHMKDNEIRGSFAEPGDNLDQVFVASNFSIDAWNQLVRNGRIMLGGGMRLQLLPQAEVSHRHSYLTEGVTAIPTEESTVDFPGATTTEEPSMADRGVFYKGCLGEVRIGNLLLPYFTPEQLNVDDNFTSKDHFFLSAEAHSSYVGVGCLLCFDYECQNGGMCANSSVSYDCECLPGFAGYDCSTDIDECLDNKCQNEATCKDGIASYTCSCAVGWTGQWCEVQINECESDPCKNGGECIDKLGSYECNCTEQYVGLQCETYKLITCEHEPCKNGSTCTNGKNPITHNNFTCHCMPGFEGYQCDIPFCMVQLGGNRSCANGLCNIAGSTPFCDCPLGYQGKYCEINIDDCASKPCLHNGKCIDAINKYTCICEGTGYEGAQCETDIDECTTPGRSQCGVGSCINREGSYTCQCPNGYCGSQCNYPDPCQESVCQNGGTCLELCVEGPGKYICECVPGYSGKNCTEYNERATSSAVSIVIIVVPIIIIILLVSAIGLSVFITMARKKRATRGTYSPSQQEYCNPRVEMDNVMKPPPEERLI